MHVGKVKTPTLLMTGELDLRTPMAQTEEYYAALKVLGVTPREDEATAALVWKHFEFLGLDRDRIVPAQAEQLGPST